MKIKASILFSFKREFLDILYGLILLAIFWMSFKLTSPFFKTIYSISHFDSSFFKVEVTSSGPKYIQVDSRPAQWVPIDQISKKAVGAIVVSEDGRFYQHKGYDIEQIQKVMALKFVTHKKKVRGASTITQQLIKNVYLTKEKSFARKAHEFYLANYIEDKVSKNKILESYLNVIEYGKGIYGIENASRFYFKKSAKNLSAKEGAFLAMLLPSPVRYAKSFHQKMLTPFANRIVNAILLKMRQGNYIGPLEYELAINSPLSFEKRPILSESSLLESGSEILDSDVPDSIDEDQDN